jgi:hypothetical protein
VEELNQIASNPEIILDPTPVRPTAVVSRRPIEEVASFKQKKS